MAVNQDELRFFGVLVNKGHLTKEAVLKCLAAHERESQKGREHTLGEIAVALGVIDRSRLEHLRLTGGEDLPEIPGVDILAKVGEGGTSKVFKAREKKSGRLIALKALEPALFRDEVQRSRFVREARLLIDLEHENVVKGHKVGRVGDDRLIFVLEFVDGDDLQDLLGAGMTFNEDAALYIVLQVARALEYLKGQGVVHRDIKPGNIMLTRQNVVKLIDLGFASSAGSSKSASDSDTTLGMAHYISPEQARGQADVDIRSDIYSLGATLYQLAIGHLPFEGRSTDEIVAKQILTSLTSPELKRKVSPYVHYFIEKMMAKDRDERYQSPRELIEDIEGQIRGKNTMMHPLDDEQNLLRRPYEPEADATPRPVLTSEQEQRLRDLRRRRRR